METFKLFYTWGKEGAGNSPDAVELLNQDFPTAEAVGPAVLLGSLDRVDYLPPPAAAPAPTDVTPLMSIGAAENAGYVCDNIYFKIFCRFWLILNENNGVLSKL